MNEPHNGCQVSQELGGETPTKRLEDNTDPAPVGIFNSDSPMPQPCCTNVVEGILLHTKADGGRISERAVCRPYGERKALLASNDPFGTEDMTTSTPFRSTRG